MVHHCICIRTVCTVCACMQSGSVNHAECALPPPSPPMSCPCAPLGVQPLMAINARERDVLHPHSSPTQNNRATSRWAQRNNLKATSTYHSDGSLTTDWRLSEVIVLLHSCWDCGFLPQCGCLDFALRDIVYKDAPQRFFVCSLFVSVKDAEGCRFGLRVGKVGRMFLSSQSLMWCYCRQRRELLRMGPTKGQHQPPPPNMRMTTLWAIQVLLLSYDS